MKKSGEEIASALDQKLKLIRNERYACQSVSRMALPNERVSMCLRMVNGNQVGVHKHRKTSRTFYGGLLVCGMVWQCPVCAAKISEKRRRELELGFSQHKENGGFISMLTLTVSHYKTDKLKDTLSNFSKANSRFTSGSVFQNIRKEIGLIGRVRVLEVTYGENGFHPHAHIALFHTNPIDPEEVKEKLYRLWEKACKAFDLKTSYEHGMDLQDGSEAEKYMSKHGTWSLEQELSKSHIKKAKNGSLSPFDFLRMYLQTEDEKYILLFREYAKYFKGKRQIHWSRGLKDMFDLEEKTDEELAKEKIEEADLLGLLSLEEWKYVLKYDLRVTLLENVEKYGFDTGIEMTLIKKTTNIEDSPSII